MITWGNTQFKAANKYNLYLWSRWCKFEFTISFQDNNTYYHRCHQFFYFCFYHCHILFFFLPPDLFFFALWKQTAWRTFVDRGCRLVSVQTKQVLLLQYLSRVGAINVNWHCFTTNSLFIRRVCTKINYYWS